MLDDESRKRLKEDKRPAAQNTSGCPDVTPNLDAAACDCGADAAADLGGEACCGAIG